MFSESFLKVLNEGVPNKPDKLSLRDVATRTQEIIKAKFGQAGVRPEVHSPRQRGTDASSLPVFPNPWSHHKLVVQQGRPSQSISKLAEASQLDDLRTEFVVPLGLLDYEFIDSISDFYFDVRKALGVVETANRELKRQDASTVLLQRSNLVLSSTPAEFWRSLFDEASLQGHRTLATVLCIVAVGLPDQLKSRTIGNIKAVIDDYFDQRRAT
jgi:hypothetical protein